MKDDDVKAQLKAIDERMKKIEEAFLNVARPYAEIAEQMQSFQEISKGYFKLMNLYQKHGQISPDMAVPGLKDPISKDILQIVIEKGALNISEITELLREKRGSASRRIVRERLQEMEANGVVVADSRGKQKKYSASEEVTNKWLELLGLVKKDDHA
jgi:DNA-binding transcriptional ArsR family regulator